jgi:regulator of protease activity HflC (stomatin/prohibitin superfamily)
MPVRNKTKGTDKASSYCAEAAFPRHIEAYNSPRTRNANENAAAAFATAIFLAVLAVVVFIMRLITGGFDIVSVITAFVLATVSVFTVRVASEWESIVILRFGKYDRTAGPGLFLTVPFIDHIALRADHRVQLTAFDAEGTLTSDLVPINVNAVVFWMVWDAKKACVEVEDYYDSVALASQTSLRDAIGRNGITDVTAHRSQLDEELRNAIAEKTEPWGISVLSVEIRDILMPQSLQEEMSAEARAERERDARIVLAEVEQDIADMLKGASAVYAEDEVAFKLRQMHLLNEGIKQADSTMVVPSAYTEGFTKSVGVSDFSQE